MVLAAYLEQETLRDDLSQGLKTELDYPVYNKS